MIESAIKITGFGWKFYFKSGWNKFDFFLVLASLMDLVMTTIGSSMGSGVFNILRFALLLCRASQQHWSYVSREQPGSKMRILSGPFRSQKLLRVTRISRMLKLIKSFRSLQSLFVTLWISLPAFWNVGALLVLIMFMYESLMNAPVCHSCAQPRTTYLSIPTVPTLLKQQCTHSIKQ